VHVEQPQKEGQQHVEWPDAGEQLHIWKERHTLLVFWSHILWQWWASGYNASGENPKIQQYTGKKQERMKHRGIFEVPAGFSPRSREHLECGLYFVSTDRTHRWTVFHGISSGTDHPVDALLVEQMTTRHQCQVLGFTGQAH
jgi:hypothetical protein